MLDHLSRAFHTFPVFALVGMKEKSIRPIAVEDVTRILKASLVEGRLSCQTVAVTGPEEMGLSEAVRRVAHVVGKRPYMFRMPVVFHYLFAWWLERIMTIPVVSLAQVRMLSEGIVKPLPPCEAVPADLAPRISFTDQQIRRGLPEAKSLGLNDCRLLVS